MNRKPRIVLNATELNYLSAFWLIRRGNYVSTEYDCEDVYAYRIKGKKHLLGTLTSIETKRTYSDFKADFKKRKWKKFAWLSTHPNEISRLCWYNCWPPHYFYYLAQYPLCHTIANSNILPDWCGVLSVPAIRSRYQYKTIMLNPSYFVRVIKRCRKINRPTYPIILENMTRRNMWDAIARRADVCKLRRGI